MNKLYENINDLNISKFKGKTDQIIIDNKIDALKDGEVDEDGKPIAKHKTALSGIMREFKKKLKRQVLDETQEIKYKDL